MRCPNCGQDNPPEARFCGKCATRLPAADAQTPQKPPSPPAPAGEVTQGLNIGIIIGSIIIPLLGIIMGLVYMNDASPAKKAAGKIWLYVGIGAVAFWCICTLSIQNLGL
jgi:hypothetical protein